jgi:predicted dehydrogenase
MFNTIAVYGGGGIGKRHVRLLRGKFPSSKIILVSQHSKPSEVLHTDIVLNNSDDLGELRPDFTFIANPASLHIDTALQVSEYCSSIFIEKPLSNSLHGIKVLEKTIKNKQIFCQIGYNLRYQPSLIFFRDYIIKAALGPIYGVQIEAGQFLPSWRPDRDYRETVSANKKMGGGVLFELSHELDYVLWIFGKPSWVSAVNGKISDLEIDVEDYAKINMGYSGSYGESDMICSVSLDFFRKNSTRSCNVICANGSIKWDGINGTVSINNEKTKGWHEVYNNLTDRDYTYKQQIDDMCFRIKNKKQAAIPIHDAVNVLNIIEAARLSSQSLSRQVFLATEDSQ